MTVGVMKTKTIAKCEVAHALTSRAYGEKKWWAVIVIRISRDSVVGRLLCIDFWANPSF